MFGYIYVIVRLTKDKVFYRKTWRRLYFLFTMTLYNKWNGAFVSTQTEDGIAHQRSSDQLENWK